MAIVDSQVHVYERNHPARPWSGVLTGPDEVTGDAMVAAMDSVGVDGAILVSAFTMYRYDSSYAQEVYAKHPGRFGLVKPVDSTGPAVEDTIAAWASTKGAVGIRLFLRDGVSTDPADPGLNRVVARAGKLGLPINMASWGRMAQVAGLAARNPDTQLVIDHLGLKQPHHPPAPADGWDPLPEVLALSALPNVAIKVSGACTLAREPYPYQDIWEPLARVFDAFGLERCLWGTDWTRAVELLTYKQGVDAFLHSDRLSDSDRVMLMGGSVAKTYKWAPSKG